MYEIAPSRIATAGHYELTWASEDLRKEISRLEVRLEQEKRQLQLVEAEIARRIESGQA